MGDRRISPVTERLLHLDVLRGFALLGILLVNFEWFARPLQAIVLGADPGLSGADQLVDWLIKVLAEGKFYPLFSMLFGAGFALMAERALNRAAPFWGVYLRRLMFLTLFGLAHMLLIWAGDILLVYSLCAFVMVLLFRNTPVRRLWKWAIAFFALPVLFIWAAALMITLVQMDPEIGAEVAAVMEADQDAMRERVEAAAMVHATGSYVDNIGQRLSDMAFLLANFIFWVPPILGFFLIGRWLVQTGRLTRPSEHQMYFRRWRARGLLGGLVLAVAATALLYRANLVMPTPAVALGSTLALASGILLSLGYLSMITLSAERLRFLAPVGQMALSNYLAQSLFWTWTFYGHGLGLWGQVPRWSHLVLALAFFAMQIIISRWWLTKFRFGPAEWLWRSLTYWQRQPMLKLD
ncbi:MAG: DUF418 domain-containing protein [Wenzhouxiangella sp.]